MRILLSKKKDNTSTQNFWIYWLTMCKICPNAGFLWPVFSHTRFFFFFFQMSAAISINFNSHVVISKIMFPRGHIFNLTSFCSTFRSGYKMGTLAKNRLMSMFPIIEKTFNRLALQTKNQKANNNLLFKMTKPLKKICIMNFLLTLYYLKWRNL